jgi:hypothetical protein
MRKLLERDKKRRLDLKNIQMSVFVLKSISQNTHLNSAMRWNAFLGLKHLISMGNASTSISSRCLSSVNKKKFNKRTKYARHIYLKMIRSSQIYGMRKSSW